MTDISSFIKNGGRVKRGRVRKATGSGIYISLPGGIRPVTKIVNWRPARHMGVRKHEWENGL